MLWRFEHDLSKQILSIIRIKWQFESQQFVESNAQRINIRSVIKDQSFRHQLLGTHVRRPFPQQIACHCQCTPCLDFGRAKIGNPGLAGTINHQVRRLNVPMNDTVVMGVVQCFGNGCRQRCNRTKTRNRLRNLFPAQCARRMSNFFADSGVQQTLRCDRRPEWDCRVFRLGWCCWFSFRN